MHRVIVVGSPRVNGRSANLAHQLFCACIDECPDDGVSIVSVASTSVAGCMGCDACQVRSDEPIYTLEAGDPLTSCPSISQSDAMYHHCVIDDDMNEVRKHLDAADELIVVSPVYFAGVPAQFKCLLDRLQPYYFSNARKQPKRPAVIHVVGEGGDPHGFDPLIVTLRSALAVAGFSVELVLDWVGKIDANGEVLAEADEYMVFEADGDVGVWGDDGLLDDGSLDEAEADNLDADEMEADDMEADDMDAADARRGGESIDAADEHAARKANNRARLSLSDASHTQHAQGRAHAQHKGKSHQKPSAHHAGKKHLGASSHGGGKQYSSASARDGGKQHSGASSRGGGNQQAQSADHRKKSKRGSNASSSKKSRGEKRRG